MLCAEEQHSWTCVSEVTEPAPQYTPAAHQQAAQPDAIQSIRVGHPGGHWQPAYHLAGRQGAAHRVERPNGSFLRKAPSRGARSVGGCGSKRTAPRWFGCIRPPPPYSRKVHFRCMSTCQIVTPDLSLRRHPAECGHAHPHTPTGSLALKAYLWGARGARALAIRSQLILRGCRAQFSQHDGAVSVEGGRCYSSMYNATFVQIKPLFSKRNHDPLSPRRRGRRPRRHACRARRAWQ